MTGNVCLLVTSSISKFSASLTGGMMSIDSLLSVINFKLDRKKNSLPKYGVPHRYITKKNRFSRQGGMTREIKTFHVSTWQSRGS